MDLLYIFAGLFVFLIALFRRGLLVAKQSYRVILALSLALFLAGLALHFTHFGRHSASGALLGALPSLLWYRLCRRVFVKSVKREPRDTLFDWNPELAADRPFNVVYFGSTPVLVMALAIGMLELAKSGW